MGKRKWPITQKRFKVLLAEGKTRKEISRLYKVSTKTVLKLGKKYGLDSKWTDEKDQELKEIWGTMPIENICRTLGRTEYSIRCRSNILKLGKMIESNDKMTFSELARALGIHRVNITRWANNGLNYEEYRVNKQVYKMISLTDFWKFAETNNRVSFHNYEIGNLNNEPDWIRERIRKDKIKKSISKGWTEEEKNRLVMLYLSGYNLNYIAERFKPRTKTVVIDTLYKILKQKNIRKRHRVVLNWQDKEIKILKNMYSMGKSDYQIAYALGRSKESVRKKRESLVNTNYLFKLSEGGAAHENRRS